MQVDSFLKKKKKVVDWVGPGVFNRLEGGVGVASLLMVLINVCRQWG